jgi:hypothetical protein
MAGRDRTYSFSVRMEPSGWKEIGRDSRRELRESLHRLRSREYFVAGVGERRLQPGGHARCSVWPAPTSQLGLLLRHTNDD